ncbi:hypothetical protein NADFUDRAFT_81185 [Nadsonia fulvescens var. elongata DSM 6958]|uniref:Uncharacterized protein n=1 Tax=Nadsonia fulvescens var. elongata DSM 6958 TaxID=857566 RepID=A0A1E3PSB4_9ASCO|nr:hypothetical protein NADFUDRAFT_81185 [Nadsonia fulvescens var. elongata DSM 6958]
MEYGPAAPSYYNSRLPSGQIYRIHDNFEILTEILPSDRARDADRSAMIIPHSAAIDLAPLIMILHFIPLSRKALLNFGTEIVNDFGYDESWWAGALIDMSDQLDDNGSDSGSDDESNASMSKRLIVECQRLMAFLDGGSKRSFATLDNLLLDIPSDYKSIFNGQVRSNDNTIGLFLKSLTKYWGENNDLSNVFRATVISHDSENEIPLCNLSVEVPSNSPRSLYQIIDEMIWPDGIYENWFVKVPDILTLTFKRGDEQSGTGFAIPEFWRPDRYKKDSIPSVKWMMERQSEVENQLAILRNKKYKLLNYQGKSVVKFLDVSVDYFKEMKTRSKDNELIELNEIEKDDPLSETMDELILIRNKWDSKIRDITETIMHLEQELEQIILLNERGELKCEASSGDTVKLRDYILSGVILSPTEFYIRTKKSQLIDDDKIEWYKFHYNAAPGTSCVVEKVTIEKVIEIVTIGSVEYSAQEVSVVYTSSEAWDDVHRISLPPKLDEFIVLDRMAFEDELSRESDPIVLADREHIESQEFDLEDKIKTEEFS